MNLSKLKVDFSDLKKSKGIRKPEKGDWIVGVGILFFFAILAIGAILLIIELIYDFLSSFAS